MIAAFARQGDQPRPLSIYCDTDTLLNNVSDPVELVALECLLGEHRAGKLVMYRSRVDLREIMATPDAAKQARLVADYEDLQPVVHDEQIVGFNFIPDQYGGFVSNPLVSDVWNEAICTELVTRGLTRRDAQHVTQAICNKCDVFLTRDVKTIIKPHRPWLESRFPNLKVFRPAELTAFLGPAFETRFRLHKATTSD